MSFAKLKQARAKSFEHIAQQFQANTAAETSSNKDERIWYPKADNAGNGSSVIRFLPPTDNAPNGLPWVKTFSHGFQGPTGSWLIEPCPTTLGEACPVCEANRSLWNSGIESDKKLASARKRKVSYYSNILVIKDPANPENEGKVFIYKYGKKIFDALNEAMNPSFDDQEPMNPFDMWEGANFRLRFRMKDGFRNYDSSAFDSKSTLNDDESVLEQIYNKMYDLNEFVDPANFKSYEQMKERLQAVTVGTPRRPAELETEVEESPFHDTKHDVVSDSTVSKSADDDDFDSFFNELEK